MRKGFRKILKKKIRNDLSHSKPIGSKGLSSSEVVEVVNVLDEIIRIMILEEES